VDFRQDAGGVRAQAVIINNGDAASGPVTLKMKNGCENVPRTTIADLCLWWKWQ